MAAASPLSCRMLNVARGVTGTDTSRLLDAREIQTPHAKGMGANAPQRLTPVV